MKKALGYKVGNRSFVVENALAMGKEAFVKEFKDKLKHPEAEFKAMQELKKASKK